jgi:hypothetical protein
MEAQRRRGKPRNRWRQRGALEEPPEGAPLPEARVRLSGTIVDHGTMNGELEDPVSEAAGILGAGVCISVRPPDSVRGLSRDRIRALAGNRLAERY